MLSPVSVVLITSFFITSLVNCYRSGSPGIDYPNYLRAPRTRFECRGRENGYFSDPEAGCQAYHVCDNGRKYSFVCPVSTLFSDSLKTCDYWYNVKCHGGQRDSDRERPQVEQPDFGESELTPNLPEQEQPGPEEEGPEQPTHGGGRGPSRGEHEPQPEYGAETTSGNDNSDDRESTPSGLGVPPFPAEPSGGAGESEGSVYQPDVVPGNPAEEPTHVPEGWRRHTGSRPNSQSKPKPWTTYPTTAEEESQSTRTPRWRTFESTPESAGTQSTSTSSDNSLIPVSDSTSSKEHHGSSSKPTTEEFTSPESGLANGRGEFRNENWVDQGMPSAAESGNDSLTDEEGNPNATNDPVSNGNRYSRGTSRTKPERRQGDAAADENGLIGSMMKWAAAASSALSLRQGEPKVTQTGPGNQYSDPKGPNPYVPFEEQERRAREQRAAGGNAASAVPRVTSPQPLPSPSTEAALNPPYAYPYEPSVNPSVANSRMHVSLNERKVYTGDRSGKGGSESKRTASPIESVDHPNPWTFPMTDQEVAEVASKPRDTYRSRRRDDPNEVSRRGKGAPEMGSGFDMMVESSNSTTAAPVTGSTPASFISGVTEILPETTKSSVQTKSVPKVTQSKPPGNFITGEVMSNGQCRCPLPDSDVYFS